ncbi:30S ribosomal protein S16 [Candidatus Phytoplasma phoenicium]|uniref:Small ribosomal subunit protein bS16 n=1 Tax=Candidatus Phytoplasma phoenicium TaxID=198422 RepID=A0A0L0MK04_9MOLU|nr:30S ribosomal protein S16 [Candidatus Phytoplasma phoenicium]KND62708.1 30S ribosomal protein S16 [Candidatus Phytoplasma phoenicium]
MSVKMRLQRYGSHKKPFYRIVTINTQNKRDGKFLEIIGIFEPFKNLINIDLQKAAKWLSAGVQPTQTVKNLLKKTKKQNNINNL